MPKETNYRQYATYQRKNYENNVEYHEHTNALFFKSQTIKYRDLVNFKTAQILCKAQYKLCPGNIQNCLMIKRGDMLQGGDFCSFP